MLENQQQPERSVEEWLRHIQIEWQLQIPQMAKILHVEESMLQALIASNSMSSKMPRENAPTIPPGFESASPFIRIYQKLAVRYPKAEDQVKWLFTEHQDFGGAKPIEVAASSLENLFWLGYYLDSAKDAKR